MDKAILKTLAYADIFDYPLTLREIHKWLIGRKVVLRQVEKVVEKLYQESRQGRGSPKAASIKYKGEYYFLPRREKLVAKRWRREKQSAVYFRKAKILSQVLKLVPWIKLVGVSGGLAVNNASKTDDIDLFIITGKNRLWISRILALGVISLFGQRRKRKEKGRKIAGKLCVNVLLEEDRLEQQSKDIFIAHEVLQMKVLWQRDGIYSKYLADNEWAFKFLPNWVSAESVRGPGVLSLRGAPATKQSNSRLPRSLRSLAMTGIENLAKWFQLKIMQEPKGKERIEDGALYFHPQDCRSEILSKYQQKLKRIISS